MPGSRRIGVRSARMVTLLATTALVAALVGCGDDAGSQVGQDGEDSSTGLAEGAENLVGRWAHYDEVAYEDDAMRTIIVSTGFADIELRDGELWNVQRFCHADTVSDQDVDIAISDTATRAIVPVDVELDVSTEDGVLRVMRPATPTGIGIALDDPADEALPTDPSDPRITDDDGDGNPGVTVTIEVTEDFVGELYIARREIFAYDVTQESPDRLVGSITDSSEQLVLGASDPVFDMPTEWVQIDDADRNPVIWERVDQDWDCERLAEERSALFPPLPDTDW